MRRTGQRGGNRGENESGFFRQEDRIGAERRKTAAGSPKGERSESICRIHRRIYGVLEEKNMLIELQITHSQCSPWLNK
jgi:hypothetical protein